MLDYDIVSIVDVFVIRIKCSGKMKRGLVGGLPMNVVAYTVHFLSGFSVRSEGGALMELKGDMIACIVSAVCRAVLILFCLCSCFARLQLKYVFKYMVCKLVPCLG